MVQNFHQAPSEIPANLPCQFSLTGQICLHWAAATLKGLGEFQKKVVDHFLLLFLGKKCQFQDSRFQSTYKMRSSWCDWCCSSKDDNLFWWKLLNVSNHVPCGLRASEVFKKDLMLELHPYDHRIGNRTAGNVLDLGRQTKQIE